MSAADHSAASPAFAELHELHRAAVRRALRPLLPEAHDVEDVLQDTFLRAYLALRERPVPAEQVRPWLVTIARNRAIDLLRGRRRTAELHDASAVSAGPAATVELRESVRAAVDAVRRLPEAQRRAFVLHAVDGAPHAAVADVLDLTPGAAKALVYRARAAVRRDAGGLAA